MTPESILKQYWGFDQFRPLQREVIQSVLDHKDTLALLPTGGGKSICFQIPALMLPGITIVVSPLIALMKDQVEGLKKKGIKAEAIYSGMYYQDVDRIMDNAVYGKLKMLYVSPERLKTQLFKERLKKMTVSLIAVDESHCISQWGYDFRPSYLNIADLRVMIGENVPILALTATATPEVAEDIQEKLNFNTPNLMSKSFERSNLTYSIHYTEDKRDALLNYVKTHVGSGIIYLRSRIKTREYSDFLNRHGISSAFYHAGLTSELRNQRQDDWISGKTRVICATNAFGMGIDKPDVRFVIHVDLPDNIEAYFQEAGRAGRDEKPAQAIAFLHSSDVIALEERIAASFPPLDSVRLLYQGICNKLQLAIGAGFEETYDLDLIGLAEHVRLKLNTVYSGLKILELNGYVALSESVWSPSTVHVMLPHHELMAFITGNPGIRELLHLILRNYNKVADDHARINEEFLAKTLGLDKTEVISKLEFMHKLEVVEYRKRSRHPQITFTTPRVAVESLHFAPESYLHRKERAMHKMKSIISYAEAKEGCRSQLLLAYFGEQARNKCGNCDLCLSENTITLASDFDKARIQVKELLQNEPIPIQVIQQKVKSELGPDHIVKVVQWLLDNQEIKTDEFNRLCIK